MTGFIGIFLAIAAGLIVSSRRQLLIAIGLPLLVVLGIQTWHIASGHAVSPPSTVTGFPQLIGYYIVQVIIFGLAYGAGDQIRMRRVRHAAGPATPAEMTRQTTRALVINAVLSAGAVLLFLLDRPATDPGSVVRHTAGGSPPVAGMGGILASAVIFAVLGVLTLIGRRRHSYGDPAVRVPAESVSHVR